MKSVEAVESAEGQPKSSRGSAAPRAVRKKTASSKALAADRGESGAPVSGMLGSADRPLTARDGGVTLVAGARADVQVPLESIQMASMADHDQLLGFS